MTPHHAPAPRLTLADRDEILSAGLDYFERVNALEYLRQAAAEQHLFRAGAYVDPFGCLIVHRLTLRGYPLTVAMRVAIRLEMEARAAS